MLYYIFNDEKLIAPTNLTPSHLQLGLIFILEVTFNCGVN